jgi:hypothetical protein
LKVIYPVWFKMLLPGRHSLRKTTAGRPNRISAKPLKIRRKLSLRAKAVHNVMHGMVVVA